MTSTTWQVRIQRPDPKTTVLWFIDADATRMTVGQFLALLEGDEAFRTMFTEVLCQTESEPFFWEMPALRKRQLEGEFECALIKAPALMKAKANPKAFAEHFVATERVVVFPNVEGDATLIAPCPTPALAWYAHFGVFLRSASRAQVHALWTVVARTVREKLGAEPMWISTSGLGVPWLHVRLDSSPKYYNYRPYTRA